MNVSGSEFVFRYESTIALFHLHNNTASLSLNNAAVSAVKLIVSSYCLLYIYKSRKYEKLSLIHSMIRSTITQFLHESKLHQVFVKFQSSHRTFFQHQQVVSLPYYSHESFVFPYPLQFHTTYSSNPCLYARMALNDNPWGQGRVYLNESDRPDWELAMKLTIIPAKFAGDNQESPITIGSGGDSDANESLSDSEDDEFDESDDYGPSVGQYGLGLDYLSTDVDLYAIGSDGFGTAAQGFGSDPDDENPAESSSKQNHELAAERFALDIEGQEDFLHSVLIEPKDDFAMGHTQQWLKEAGSQGLYEPARGLLHPRAFQVKYAPRVPGVGDGDGVYRA